MQLNTVECGAACLAMVLSYFRRNTSIAECRPLCGGGRGGVSAATIVSAARQFGLTARGYRPAPELFSQIELPAVAHWERNHFVVVERWSPRSVDIVDPAWGRRRLSTAEFEAGVSDAVLVMQPGEGFERRGQTAEPSTGRTLFATMTSLPGIRSVMAQILFVTVLLQLFGLALPVATKLIVDNVFGARQDALIVVIGLALGVTILAQMVATYLRYMLLIYLQGRLDWHLLTGFAEHIFRLRLRFFHERTTGDIAVRLGSIGTLRDMLANQTMAAILDATLLLIYVALMFVFDVVLALVVVGVLATQVLLVAVMRGRVRDLMARSVSAQARVQEYMVQTLSGIATVKATGAEGHTAAETSDRLTAWTAATLRRGHLVAGMETFSTAVRTLTPLLVLWLGIWRVMDGRLSLGTMIGFIWLAGAVLGPVSTLAGNWQRLQMAGILLERLGDVLREPGEPTGTLQPPPSGAKGSAIELRNVCYRYDEHGPPALDDVSFVVEPGARVAIVGRSGAGKSTLAMLLLGLYQPTSGQLLFEGVPYAQLDVRALRRRFGAVVQEHFTIRGTVLENIAFAHPDASKGDILWAARVAEVHDEVDRLPLKYDTPLAERGVGLSGGQLQRLAIARALVGRPSLLILDEATSHLDSETEQRIVANLREVACTQIVIAHRLSTIREADLIIVLHDGQIIEVGNHSQLVEAGGPYSALVAAQIGLAAASNGAAPADCDPLASLLNMYQIES
uniref:Cyclolysin secretion/processing ATP-binding protein CyaB n=1 Tax=uncultured bacterium esnapd14 TaxID=1366594 RepID=S5TUQ6_9BACT|nr:cyclolysin secretion/processing ATP-binding protein CyaB [uncultured bacterium esnapd14]